ncbi:MAG: SMC family ATPase, partial [Clostridia bacterium]|nr:SMC family ATPase [Clostridia bacterium]
FEIAAERVVAAKGELKKAEEEAQKSVEEYNKIPSYEEDRDKYSKLSAGLDALRPDYLKLKDIEGKNEDLRKQYKLLTQSLKAADGELTANNAAIFGNAEEIERLEKLCDFSVALKEVGDRALYGEFKGQTEYYQNRLKEVEKFADGGKLYREIVSEYGRKLEEYAAKTAALGIAESGFGSVGERIKELQANLEKLDKARKIKEVLTKTDKEINQKRQNISVEIKDVEDEGKRNAETAFEIRKKIERLITKADDFESESTRVKTLAEAAAESLRKVRLNYEKSKAEVDEKSGKLSEEKGNLKAKTDIFGAAETALKGLFTESVPTVNEARSVISALSDEEGARRKVADFEANLRADLKRREELSEKLAEVGFSAQKYADTEQKCAAVSQTVKNLHEILGNYKNNASILSQNFSKRCIIEKQITSENKRRATLDKLERAVGNRKFIEYVAAEYLSDVADAASDTLLYLTGGKYDVTYRDKLADETKNGFYVHDNLNGGVERSVASLSGGETFLVSLSLALALSAEICAKSDRPMEFFFLDEGFGTLDDELVDTVMDGLEKLRGKNGEFTIGVISHLAAMKARIECRINVTAANGDKGSSVSVSI